MTKRAAKVLLVSLATLMLVGCQADDRPMVASTHSPALVMPKRVESRVSRQLVPGHRGRHVAWRVSPVR